MSGFRVGLLRVRRRVEALVRDLAGPPVDVFALAVGNGAEVRVLELAPDVSGILYREDDRRVIVVNGAQSIAQQRFAAGHNLGHLLLHRGGPVHVDEGFRVPLKRQADTAEAADEIEANAFAAHLLMPERWLDQDLEADAIELFDDARIGRLAHRYGVNAATVLFRLCWL